MVHINFFLYTKTAYAENDNESVPILHLTTCPQPSLISPCKKCTIYGTVMGKTWLYIIIDPET